MRMPSDHSSDNRLLLHHVIRRELARLRAGLDLDGRVVHVVARAQLLAHFRHEGVAGVPAGDDEVHGERGLGRADRKSTRLNSSHSQISYAVFCLKKKNKTGQPSAIANTGARSSISGEPTRGYID